MNGEVGRGEEGEDLGGDVVATVVHQFAELPHDLLEDLRCFHNEVGIGRDGELVEYVFELETSQHIFIVLS